MDSESKKELELKLERLVGNLENSIQQLFDKDSVEQKSLLNRVLNYILFTLFIFIIGLFQIIKDIILLRFSGIPIQLKIMNKMDVILRKYLML